MDDEDAVLIEQTMDDREGYGGCVHDVSSTSRPQSASALARLKQRRQQARGSSIKESTMRWSSQAAALSASHRPRSADAISRHKQVRKAHLSKHEYAEDGRGSVSRPETVSLSPSTTSNNTQQQFAHCTGSSVDGLDHEDTHGASASWNGHALMQVRSGEKRIGRLELLRWVYQCTGLDYARVSELADGVAYNRLLALVFPFEAQLNKVAFSTSDVGKKRNLRTLQSAFDRLGVDKVIDIDAVASGSFSSNNELLRWFYTFIKRNARTGMPSKAFRRPPTSPASFADTGATSGASFAHSPSCASSSYTRIDADNDEDEPSYASHMQPPLSPLAQEQNAQQISRTASASGANSEPQAISMSPIQSEHVHTPPRSPRLIRRKQQEQQRKSQQQYPPMPSSESKLGDGENTGWKVEGSQQYVRADGASPERLKKPRSRQGTPTRSSGAHESTTSHTSLKEVTASETMLVESEQAMQEHSQQHAKQQQKQQQHKAELERLCRWLEGDLQGRLQAISSSKRAVATLRMECDELQTQLTEALRCVEHHSNTSSLARAVHAALQRC